MAFDNFTVIVVFASLFCNGVAYTSVAEIAKDHKDYCPYCSTSPTIYLVKGHTDNEASIVPSFMEHVFLEEYLGTVMYNEETCRGSCKSLPGYVDLDNDEILVTPEDAEYPEYYTRYGDVSYASNGKGEGGNVSDVVFSKWMVFFFGLIIIMIPILASDTACHVVWRNCNQQTEEVQE